MRALITGVIGSRFSWDDLESLYINDLMSQYQIAKLKGCSQPTVFNYLRYKGIKSRLKNGAGERNSFFGRKHSEDTKQRLAKASTGNTFRRGQKQPSTVGDNNPSKRLEVRVKISQNRKGISTGCGEKNINWKGGVSFDPYDSAFYAVRKFILERDKHICQLCGGHEHLGVHHKDEDKMNSSVDNLVTLCVSCHSKLHWQKSPRIKEAILA